MVNINIQKKDLWLLSAIMVFLVGVGFVISYNPSGTGGTPSIMGHSSDEIEGGAGVGFGAWTNLDSDSNSLVKDVVYKATSDGFVTAYITPAGSYIMYGYTDSNDATILRFVAASAHAATGNPKGSITMPVRKDDYWKITGSPDANKIHWIPIGNGVCERQ